MTYYVVILYNVAGEEIYKEKWIDYKSANDFLFSSQFDNDQAAGGKIQRVTELHDIIILDKCLVFGMWTPFDNQDLVDQYNRFMRG